MNQNVATLIITNNPKLASIKSQILAGNKQSAKQYFKALKQLLLNRAYHQIVYEEVTTLVITAIPQIVNDVNNQIFQQINKQHQIKELDPYIIFWKNLFDGSKEKQDYPNVKKTFSKINVSNNQMPPELKKYQEEFRSNLMKIQQKKVQFFQDFQDSFVSESIQDQSRLSQIIYMDIMQIKAIRQKVQSQPLTNENCEQILIKLKTFLNLKSSTLQGDLLTQFNKQKIWAKHFIEKYREYLTQNRSNTRQISRSNQIISLSRDQESIENINRQKYQYRRTLKEPTFGNINNRNSVDDSKNFKYKNNANSNIINQLPMDQSNFTDRQRQSKLPIFNNSKNQNSRLSAGTNKNQEKQEKNNNQHLKSKKQSQNEGILIYKPAESMSFNPAQSRQKYAQSVKIARPKPQETLPIQLSMVQQNQSNFLSNKNNILPKQTAKINMSKVKPYTIQQNSGSSNANYGYDQNNQNQYMMKQKPNSPTQNQKNYKKQDFRNAMGENNLQFDNTESEKDLVVVKYSSPQSKTIKNKQQQFKKPGSYNILFNQTSEQYLSPNAKLKVQDLGYQTQYAKSSNKFNISQQLSPRSLANYSKSSKKRLSELTSQKKQRKILAPRHQVYQIQDYISKPYTLHFDQYANFIRFRRNCFQQIFTLYASSDLVISGQLKKTSDNKVQIHLSYANQGRQQLSVNSVYKIPRCFKIQKVNKIHKRFIVKDLVVHIFNLNIVQFPLEICILQLSYGNLQTQSYQNINIAIPITIRNFIQTIVVGKEQWVEHWQRLNKQGVKFRCDKSFQIQKNIIDPEDIKKILVEFIQIQPIQGYSIQQYGCLCHYRNLNGLLFLLRMSVRVDSLITFQVVTEGQVSQNQKEFIHYYLGILIMLLGKYQI